MLNAAFGGNTDWDTSPGDDKYRRALYTFWRRTTPYPSMVTFDAPGRNVCAVNRPRTNTPLQALVTLNDPVYVEAAQALARRMVREGGAAVEDRARHGFRLCLARPPRPEELKRLGPYEKQAEVLGPVFARHGYVFLYLFRRGVGLSADQGTNAVDAMNSEAAGTLPTISISMRLNRRPSRNDSSICSGLRYCSSPWMVA